MSDRTASQLFDFEYRDSPAASVTDAWRTTSVPEERFISVAAWRWEIVITRQDDRAWMTVRGPETRASIAPIPSKAEFIGIRFTPGVFMPSLPPSTLVDGEHHAPAHDRRWFRLEGSSFELPTFDDVDAFVQRLVRAELLVHDEIVAAALSDGVVDVGARSVQRRIARATGVPRRLITQIERAERAAAMLARGSSIGDVVADAGYSDQAHLTRSVRRFIGQTPTQLASVPFKTH